MSNDHLEELRREILVGIEQLDAGRSVVLDEETLESIKKRGRERLAGTNVGSHHADGSSSMS